MRTLVASSPVNVVVEPLESRRLFASVFVQTNLVSDGAVSAAHTDADLKNPWGVSFLPTGPWWISDNGTSKTTVYDSGGNKVLSVNIPGAGGADSAPTGQVQNPFDAFMITKNGVTKPATFLFAGEDGGISGWNDQVDEANAVIAVDNSASQASYKGLAIGILKHQPRLYLANFKTGVVEMYDGNFRHLKQRSAFSDPNLPQGYAPFNVQNLGGGIIGVTFAKVGPDGDDVAGRKHGVVDLFSTSGVLLRRMRRGNYMNSPWGMTFAPQGFGDFAGDLLVGMFGSGRIAAFHPKTGKFLGYVNDNTGMPVQNDGLWALQFGNGGQAGPTTSMFFTAGLNDEADGLFGKIEVTT
jgi:uncharacterized protein (TIGR03118 family)